VTTCARVLHGEADGVKDITVDWFDGVAVMNLYAGFAPAEEERLIEVLGRALDPRAIYLKRRPKEARVVATTEKDWLAPPAPVWGEPVEQVDVLENGLRFRIRPGQGLAVGLYLDTRDARSWLRERSAGKTVLNCFAYTCGFGVYAHAGGALRAVNVDLSRRVLEQGEENLQLNGGTPDRRDHIAGDVFDWLGRFAKKGERFDIIILDPPGFSSTNKGTFSAKRDYPKLVEKAAQVLSAGGTLMACCNVAELDVQRFESLVQKGLASGGRAGKVIERLRPSGVDYPAHPEAPTDLKVVALAC
jgi:23S rRNA (cytosine1962-C5)-methyltransferase